MSKVEGYDLTGKYPERAALEKELDEVEKRLFKARSLLSRSSVASSIDAGLGIPISGSSHGETEELIADLEARRHDIKNELFRIDPTHTG